MQIVFACGHTSEVAPTATRPTCGCGETRRRRVLAPPPRFTGAVRGPLATTTPVAPIAIPLVPPKE